MGRTPYARPRFRAVERGQAAQIALDQRLDGRQLRPADHQAAGRALSGRPARAPPHGTGRDVGIRPPAGVVEKEITKGSTPKSEVGVVFTGPFQNNPRNRSIFQAMANTLGGSLQRVLREDLGGTYGVSVVPDFTKRPIEEHRLTITFACDPARTQDLVKTLFAVIEEFRRSGPSASQVADAQAGLRRDLETDSRQNGYLLNQLAFAYQYR